MYASENSGFDDGSAGGASSGPAGNGFFATKHEVPTVEVDFLSFRRV